MSNEGVKQSFLSAVEAWVCDQYSLDVRYLADSRGQQSLIWDASVTVLPLPPQVDVGFSVDARGVAVGQLQRTSVAKRELLDILTKASAGEISVPGLRLTLPSDRPLSYDSEMIYRERWFYELHLQVMGARRPQPEALDLAAVDSVLRRSTPPFDGLVDAAGWLGLNAPGAMTSPPSISIRVVPPVDLIFERCSLADDLLTLGLDAHSNFDTSRVGLAVRAAPGFALEGRRQVAGEIQWGGIRDGRRSGIVRTKLRGADNVLAVLLIEDSTVRRQWFIDPTKARNNRFLAVQHFDKDLRMIRSAVLETSDSSKFERGVAALLFLLGFTPAIQIETDAPDLIVTTPGGSLAIVECTTRIADVASKVGKIVDRRSALSKSLAASGHPAQVAAFLLCRLPRDQIAAHMGKFDDVVLLTKEDLVTAFDRVRAPTNPDEVFASLVARLAPRSEAK